MPPDAKPFTKEMQLGRPKEARSFRKRAGKRRWEQIAEAKQGPCRCCAAPPPNSLHHIVPRSHGGADTEANIAPLCGSGTTGCHGLVEHREIGACRLLVESLTDAEYSYAVHRGGEGFLERRYGIRYERARLMDAQSPTNRATCACGWPEFGCIVRASGNKPGSWPGCAEAATRLGSEATGAQPSDGTTRAQETSAPSDTTDASHHAARPERSEGALTSPAVAAVDHAAALEWLEDCSRNRLVANELVVVAGPTARGHAHTLLALLQETQRQRDGMQARLDAAWSSAKEWRERAGSAEAEETALGNELRSANLARHAAKAELAATREQLTAALEAKSATERPTFAQVGDRQWMATQRLEFYDVPALIDEALRMDDVCARNTCAASTVHLLAHLLREATTADSGGSTVGSADKPPAGVSSPEAAPPEANLGGDRS